MNSRLIILCNYLDDTERYVRNITTDSPAASRKIHMLCQSLKKTDVNACILSMGRGRADGSLQYFSGKVKRIDGISVIYLPFSKIPLISEFLSFFGSLIYIWRYRKQTKKAVMYYNRRTAYIGALIFSKLLGYRNILDLEDGEVQNNSTFFHRIFINIVQHMFDAFCTHGALLACESLNSFTRIRPAITYYGIVKSISPSHILRSDSIRILFCGTISPDTGASLLKQAICIMRTSNQEWTRKLVIEITGKGESAQALASLQSDCKGPLLIYHGRTSDIEYNEILKRSDVGLALKLNNGLLANSTFPSKVVEFAAAGKLVVTTDISDVRDVLGDEGACYLKNNDAHELVSLLKWIAFNRDASITRASIGFCNVGLNFEPIASGKRIERFIFG